MASARLRDQLSSDPSVTILTIAGDMQFSIEEYFTQINKINSAGKTACIILKNIDSTLFHKIIPIFNLVQPEFIGLDEISYATGLTIFKYLPPTIHTIGLENMKHEAMQLVYKNVRSRIMSGHKTNVLFGIAVNLSVKTNLLGFLSNISQNPIVVADVVDANSEDEVEEIHAKKRKTISNEPREDTATVIWRLMKELNEEKTKVQELKQQLKTVNSLLRAHGIEVPKSKTPKRKSRAKEQPASTVPLLAHSNTGGEAISSSSEYAIQSSWSPNLFTSVDNTQALLAHDNRNPEQIYQPFPYISIVRN